MAMPLIVLAPHGYLPGCNLRASALSFSSPVIFYHVAADTSFKQMIKSTLVDNQ